MEPPKPEQPNINETPDTDIRMWKTGEPPHDREVILLGKVLCREDSLTWAEGFCCRAIWHNGVWCHAAANEYGTRMSIRVNADDETLVQYWAELPLGDRWPVHVLEKPLVEK